MMDEPNANQRPKVTYYITAMPQFSSLATCVANAVSYAVNEVGLPTPSRGEATTHPRC